LGVEQTGRLGHRGEEDDREHAPRLGETLAGANMVGAVVVSATQLCGPLRGSSYLWARGGHLGQLATEGRWVKLHTAGKGQGRRGSRAHGRNGRA
jgi:hypothetical protein